ncbi:MAG: helix-turn-helix domain-containing protein [bacterium]
MVTNYPDAFKPDSLSEFRLFKLNGLKLEKNKKPNRGKWHSFIYVSSGSGVLLIDFDEHIAIRNKLFFIEKYKYLNWIKLDTLEGLMVQFTDSFYNLIYTGNPKIKSDHTLIEEFSPFIKIEENNESEWKDVIDIILNEYSVLKENSREIICLSLKILIMMYRRNAYAKSKLIIADRKKQLLSEFRKLVNSRFAELKTPKRFAQILSITPNYLNTICKEIYNKTVSEIIQERIILEAKRLLAHSGLSVSEISYKLGFKDNSYFGRYFKKAVGMPPEKYRTVNYNSLNV